MSHMMYGWVDGGWAVVWMVLFWAVLVGVVVVLVRGLSHGTRVSDGTRLSDRRVDARDILDERFARGEISAEEYRDRRQVLEANR